MGGRPRRPVPVRLVTLASSSFGGRPARALGDAAAAVSSAGRLERRGAIHVLVARGAGGFALWSRAAAWLVGFFCLFFVTTSSCDGGLGGCCCCCCAVVVSAAGACEGRPSLD